MRYPLGVYERENVKSKTGKKMIDITLEGVIKNQITAEDIKISKEVLEEQGNIAKSCGNAAMQKNFKRAAELVDVPDEIILKMYDKLRPNRSTKAELVCIAEELSQKYKAKQCADLVMEAVKVYEKRGILL